MQKNKTSGITLIALIITIIILLILAGVTIAALTGSDSAPAKANEASQKNDIGTAQDDVYLAAQNAQMEAYQAYYVEPETAAGVASTNVGTYVRTKLNQKYGETGTFKTGLATITATASGNITIWTTDFEITGEIAEKGGQLTWGEMVPNTPGVFLSKTSETLNPGGSLVLTARKKSVSESITWSKVSGGAASISVTEDSGDDLKATVNVTAGASNGDTATIKASAGGYEATCTITVEKVPVQKVSFNNAPTSIDKGDTVTLTITATDNSNKPATPTSVTFASSDTTVATIAATSGELEGKKAGTTTISVTASDGTNSANASFTLTVIGSVIGQYVDYAVSYTDRYSGIEYGKETAGVRAVDAWRILDPGTKNEDGSYSGAKIISTGIPAKLAYRSSNENDWWGGTGNANVRATYGMKYNFTSIPFILITPQITSVNYGEAYYNAITNSDSVSGVTNIENGSIFITSKAKTTDDTNTTDIESVHALTLEEMNTAINKLNGLKSGDTGYRSETNTDSVSSYDLFHMELLSNYTQDYWYWLASPNTDSTKYVWIVSASGGLNYYDGYTLGVRPVVSLKSDYKIVKDAGTGRWQIVANNS